MGLASQENVGHFLGLGLSTKHPTSMPHHRHFGRRTFVTKLSPSLHELFFFLQIHHLDRV